MNNRDIRKLLSQKTVTGEEVGQALIRDMVCLYVDANTAPEGAPEGLLSEEDRRRLVSMLADPEDVRVYNQYRSVQMYLTAYPVVFASLREAVESAFSRLYATLVSARSAELAAQELLGAGVDAATPGLARLRSELGLESLAHLHAGLSATAGQMVRSLRMCVAQERGLEMVAARIRVPELLVYEQFSAVPYARYDLALGAQRALRETLRAAGRPQDALRLVDGLLPRLTRRDLEPRRADEARAQRMLREDLSCVEDPFALVTAITGGLSPTAAAAGSPAAAGERANPLSGRGTAATAGSPAAAGESANPLSGSGSGTAAGTAAAATAAAGERANPLSGSGTAAATAAATAGEEVRP